MINRLEEKRSQKDGLTHQEEKQLSRLLRENRVIWRSQEVDQRLFDQDDQYWEEISTLEKEKEQLEQEVEYSNNQAQKKKRFLKSLDLFFVPSPQIT